MVLLYSSNKHCKEILKGLVETRSHDETICCFAFLGLEQLLNHSFILSAPQLYAKEKLEMQMLAPRHSSIL